MHRMPLLLGFILAVLFRLGTRRRGSLILHLGPWTERDTHNVLVFRNAMHVDRDLI
jgi:hypothetical protein